MLSSPPTTSSSRFFAKHAFRTNNLDTWLSRARRFASKNANYFQSVPGCRQRLVSCLRKQQETTVMATVHFIRQPRMGDGRLLRRPENTRFPTNIPQWGTSCRIQCTRPLRVISHPPIPPSYAKTPYPRPAITDSKQHPNPHQQHPPTQQAPPRQADPNTATNQQAITSLRS